MRKALLALVLAGCVARAAAVADPDGGAVDLATERDLATHQPDFSSPIDLLDASEDLLPVSPDLFGLNKPLGSACTSTNTCCFPDKNGNGCPAQECGMPDPVAVAADNGWYPWGCCESQPHLNDGICCVGWWIPPLGPFVKHCA